MQAACLASVDDAIGALDQLLRQREAERLGAALVDDELEAARDVDRRFRRTRALEQARRDARAAAQGVGDVGTVACERAGLGPLQAVTDQGHAVTQRRL